jgi:hypothetical protein
MAFQLARETQKIVFDETSSLNDLNLEVRGDVSLQTFFDLQSWMASGEPQQMHDACVLFGEQVLASWELEDDGEPIEPDGAGFLMLPFSMAVEIINAWATHAGSAGEALSPSANGTST